MERLILQSDQVDSRDNQNPSNFATPDHRNDGSQMLLLDDRYLTLRLSTSRVMVSDQAGADFKTHFRDNFNDAPASRAQTDPLNTTVLEMFDFQVSDDLRR